MTEEKLKIPGGRQLHGEISVQGAKNSSLPILAAAVLCRGQTEIYNCPKLSDCDAACRILSSLGCGCKREGNVVCVNSSAVCTSDISEKLMREMRSSIIFMGALLGILFTRDPQWKSVRSSALLCTIAFSAVLMILIPSHLSIPEDERYLGTDARILTYEKDHGLQNYAEGMARRIDDLYEISYLEETLTEDNR